LPVKLLSCFHSIEYQLATHLNRCIVLSNIWLASVAMSTVACGGQDLARSSPADYLNKALNIIQSRALNSGHVDWKVVRAKSLELAAGAKTATDTYPAINYALAQLGDNHSFLIGRNGKATRRYEASGTRPTLQERVESNEVLQLDDQKFGFIVIRGLADASETAAAKRYAELLQKTIDRIGKQKPSGWIVDLRGNTGGNMWPMIVGVGPLLGSGTLGFFQYSKLSVPWYYERGQAGVENASGKHANFKLSESIADCAENASVAILIDGATGSSGEALSISFKGRPNTRFFGQHTFGLSTANEDMKLGDGAVIFLTTSVEADRNHVLYASGVAPDVSVEQGDTPLGSANDPGIKAALEWLKKQT
jgi:carboxyl-terminal processing protease